eukprot:scaffold219063_cov35-Prasinocladus_malaysianus.AAC.1
MESRGMEQLFISHCWRDPDSQTAKKLIISHLSTPVQGGGPGLTYWADYLDLQAQGGTFAHFRLENNHLEVILYSPGLRLLCTGAGPIPWRSEIEEGIARCSKFVVVLDKAWLTSYNCLQ